MLAIRLERKCRRVRDIKQANSDNKIRGRKGVGGVGRGQSSKSSGGVRGDDACNNIKGANADNKIRAMLTETDVSFHGEF